MFERAVHTIVATITLVASTAGAAQSAQQLPLPPNYQTIFQNKDVFVMRVHYGPHEVVPMHDHSAFTTVYVYLNDSGVVRIDHEGAGEASVNRPPTHTGAFRISPGVAERHSVTNLDEKPSDFLRVELKRIPANDIKDVFRGPVPTDLKPGKAIEFKDASLQVERVLCTQATACVARPEAARSLLVAITPAEVKTAGTTHNLQTGEVVWIPANEVVYLKPDAQLLRISLLYP
jgi:quercetin dioxygenase-like cupin family protein